MSDLVDEQDLQRIEELLKRKAELEEQNSNLSSRLQDGEKIKNELKEARRDSQKLLHHREKLKNQASKHLKGLNGAELVNPSEPKRVINNEDRDKEEKLPNPQNRKEEIMENDPVQLRRQLNALRLENASLIKEKRKTEEHNSSLVQELADLGLKHETLQEICDRLKKEIARLSACVAAGKSSSAGNHSTGKEDNIEIMKDQLRIYQEDINGMQAQIEISQQSNERLRAELNEARAVIRDLRQLPAFEVYAAPVYQLGRYKTFDDRYGYDPREYRHTVRPASGGYDRNRERDYRRVRSADKKVFMPDLTAVIDKEVKDGSLMSSKSF
ncbi:uncharacterized protein LOC110244163 [Exaiptasia diaphana]|uniref:Uncharacterized protein n=1 Tax=Exaiptasia diaphana TaxID=2652724 RepID=A0A913XKW5_EXADI|nr:uncharacterized protein LOC110244163 [Exaiptasia diaphana]KXJ25709.1 hypothetical protein AC249_AIPGENE26750 [Exaiptasia diaphana]